MKKLLPLVFILLPFFCQAQEKSSIAASYGFGNGELGSFLKTGSPYSQKQKSLRIFGFNYWHQIGKKFYFETGMQLIRYEYVTTSSTPNFTPTNNTLNIISVPFKLRFEAGKYLFFNGGLIAGLSKSKPNAVKGLGAGIGAGLQVKVVKKISLYVNPQANIHGVLPAGSLLAESNITFGASYQIN